MFSTDEPGVLTDLHRFIINTCILLTYPRLTLNYEKTIFASKKGNRTVTGLVLTNDDQISIGHSRKRKLRTLIHRYEYGKLEEAEIDWLRGYLAFVRDVEPTLYKKLLDKAQPTTQTALFQ